MRSNALTMALVLGTLLLGAEASAQLTKPTFPEEGQSVALPYYVTNVSAMAKGHQSGVYQELRPARGTTPERFVLTLSVSDNAFANGQLTLKNGYQTLDTRTSFKLYLVVDNPAQHPTLYQYLLHCSNLAGTAFRGYSHSPNKDSAWAEDLGRVYVTLQALPGSAMSLSKIDNNGKLTINLTNLAYDALKCSTSW